MPTFSLSAIDLSQPTRLPPTQNNMKDSNKRSASVTPNLLALVTSKENTIRSEESIKPNDGVKPRGLAIRDPVTSTKESCRPDSREDDDPQSSQKAVSLPKVHERENEETLPTEETSQIRSEMGRLQTKFSQMQAQFSKNQAQLGVLKQNVGCLMGFQTPQGYRTVAMNEIFASLREVAPEGSHYSVDFELDKIRQSIVDSPQHRQEKGFSFPS
ncbi:unnamed protein product [Cylindrotheca closterium]|uniref:Uncharacterized protein n=1 Tax=Cylindrotheca closterium TaxID=2856 RepID=A0AAD2FJV3_9STRA|nr:unnamed protein product [Cylindrotheca closterium]